MPKRSSSDLARRLLTAGIASPCIIYAMFWAPRWAFLAILTVTVCIASLELMQMFLPNERLAQAWGVLHALALFGTLCFASSASVMMAIWVLLMLSSFGLLLSVYARHEEPLSVLFALMMVPFYVGLCIACMGRLHLGVRGPYWVMFAMTSAWFNDSIAYFVGRAIGRRKLCPSISPGKTIEGSVAGLVGSVIAGVLAHVWYLPSLPLVPAVLTAGFAGQAGDLSESLIKRCKGAKDSSRLLPGHGGMLDRMDGFMFSAAVVWLYTAFIHP